LIKFRVKLRGKFEIEAGKI
jgi:hypothetical protein